MAFVILSAGTLAQSNLRTISARTFLGVSALAVMAAVGGGFALGYGFSPAPESRPVTVDSASIDPAQPEGRLLIDRFGELSGRMVQLEAEAAGLAARIGLIKDFEARIKDSSAAEIKSGRIAKTPPAASAGGPWLTPSSAFSPRVADPVSRLVEASQRVEMGEPSLLTDELSRMEQDIERVRDAFMHIDKLATTFNLAYMAFPGRSPVADVDITSTFGNRVDPFQRRPAFHSGVDYPALKGTAIAASGGGRVSFAGYRAEYGNTVEIDHGGGLVTRYAHASKLHARVGQIVMPGQKIAEIGSTGRSTGSHLHFEVIKDGLVVDPAYYLARF
ncbi:M23 family metallopeptidase [Aromatoleum diolicum]|uniref:Peptidoglycan DD-metalloendopeptidase family protein n=1 Tax=Aromatoleum diolicum TaxID=75796 RepID=A0ABX1QEQ9_9RHOO|nr:M23 family metallopeptidase [Aromatoleum diolicum]NMG75550.1 peptidoglycan DD-metalloendopeptidase family protein [Aromatoleum diolicum]